MASENLEWRELESRELLRTPVFTVTERLSRGPDGREGRYIVNDAPDWVIVVPVVGDSFLMVEQWRHGERALSIEFPGGVVERGEDPAVGARRELREETGAVAGRLTHLGSMNPNPALFSNHVHVYCAEELAFSGEQELDADEFLHAFKMRQADVAALLGKAEFPHGLMAAALGLYWGRRGDI